MQRSKLIYLAGEPATGKSTLMKLVMKKLGGYHVTKIGKVTTSMFPLRKVVILGEYVSHKTFGGTDRLPMDAQPHVIRMLHSMPDWHVLAEGDRLLNAKFLDAVKELYDVSVFRLVATEEEISARRTERESKGVNQTDKFLKGRRTKIKNLMKIHPMHALPNEGIHDLEVNAEMIAELCHKKSS